MNIDAKAAASALKDIDRATARTAAFSGYRRSWPSFLVWGLVWSGANITQQFAPEWANVTWMIGLVAGISSSIFVGMSARPLAATGATRPTMARYIGAGLIIAVAISAVFNIVGVRDAVTANAAMSLFVAAAYAVMGLWHGSRFLCLGLLLGGVIIAGWAYGREYFALWMGLAGGGALILTAFWLRRA